MMRLSFYETAFCIAPRLFVRLSVWHICPTITRKRKVLWPENTQNRSRGRVCATRWSNLRSEEQRSRSQCHNMIREETRRMYSVSQKIPPEVFWDFKKNFSQSQTFRNF